MLKMGQISHPRLHRPLSPPPPAWPGYCISTHACISLWDRPISDKNQLNVLSWTPIKHHFCSTGRQRACCSGYWAHRKYIEISSYATLLSFLRPVKSSLIANFKRNDAINWRMEIDALCGVWWGLYTFIAQRSCGSLYRLPRFINCPTYITLHNTYLPELSTWQRWHRLLYSETLPVFQ